MSTDVSRVYQFLAKFGDWQSVADTNSDGAILKAEFRTFMEDNFEWNGEDASAQNDLINDFWKKIDTKQSGGIKGTRLVNKNALDSSELEAMDKKIALYEILNNFTSNLSAPSVVSDSANWKKSVSAGLAALVDKYTGSEEELLAYLEEQSPLIESKATADYCANEYLNSEMASIVKDYGYAYADDTTLQGMIDTYIQNISGEADANEIQQTVINIIDAYLATAGLKEDNAFDLSQYGYSTSSTSALNDLQKSVLTKNLTSALQEGDLKEDYENNTDLFTTAIESYIGSLKFGDFETVSADVLNSFKASDEYNGVKNTIQTNELFESDELKNAIASAISQEFADRVSGLMKGELEIYDTIKEEIATQVQNGDFSNDDGSLNTQKVIDAIIQKMQENVAEFYPNGFGNMSLDTLNSTYDALVKAAKENEDAAAYKEAAISYCKAVASKSDALAEAVKEVFGDDYASSINELTTPEIDEMMSELKVKVLELGDPDELTLNDSTWQSFPDGNVVVSPGGSKTFAILPSFSDEDGNSKTITTDRISYKSSNESLISIDKNTGTVTVNGTANGIYAATVTILVDGVEVGKRTVNVRIIQDGFDWASMSDINVQGYVSEGGDATPNRVVPLSQLYEGNGVMNLLNSSGLLGGIDWHTAVSRAKTSLASFVDTLAEACAASGVQYDQAALNTAKEKVVALYNTAFDHSLGHWAGEQDGRYNTVEYDGETYHYHVAKFHNDGIAMDSQYSYGSSASNNQLGLRIGEQYDDTKFQIVVNVKCVMDFFNKFYQQALGF